MSIYQHILEQQTFMEVSIQSSESITLDMFKT